MALNFHYNGNLYFDLYRILIISSMQGLQRDER